MGEFESMKENRLRNEKWCVPGTADVTGNYQDFFIIRVKKENCRAFWSSSCRIFFLNFTKKTVSTTNDCIMFVLYLEMLSSPSCAIQFQKVCQRFHFQSFSLPPPLKKIFFWIYEFFLFCGRHVTEVLGFRRLSALPTYSWWSQLTSSNY